VNGIADVLAAHLVGLGKQLIELGWTRFPQPAENLFVSKSLHSVAPLYTKTPRLPVRTTPIISLALLFRLPFPAAAIRWRMNGSPARSLTA
jgi:hypothetical protein